MKDLFKEYEFNNITSFRSHLRSDLRNWVDNMQLTDSDKLFETYELLANENYGKLCDMQIDGDNIFFDMHYGIVTGEID